MSVCVEGFADSAKSVSSFSSFKISFENENHNHQNYSRQPMKKQCTAYFLMIEDMLL